MTTFVTHVVDRHGVPKTGALVEIAQLLDAPLRAKTDRRGKATFHVTANQPVLYMRADGREDPRRLYPVCASGEEVTLKA